MVWSKGQSGNPSGRPKVAAEIQVLAREHTEDALKALVDIVNDDEVHPGARVSAATVLLDRGYGKAPQHLTGDVAMRYERIERIIVNAGQRAASLPDTASSPALPEPSGEDE